MKSSKKKVSSTFIITLLLFSFIIGLFFVFNPNQLVNKSPKSTSITVGSSQETITDFASWSRNNIKIGASGEL